MKKGLSKEIKSNDRANSGILYFCGFRYWTASLLPALVGTTLPFWLNPQSFSFKWLEAFEFLILTALLHGGFSFLYALVEKRFTAKWTKARLLWTGIICLSTALLIGLHLNAILQLNLNVQKNIFIIWLAGTIFTGLLYIAPPISFFRRIGGEIIISVGFGLMPVIGAYLVQAGDLTRTVYIAAMPLVVSTGLWVWIAELIRRPEDERTGRSTMVTLFTPIFSGRIATLIIVIILYAVLLLAVFARPSLHPLSLIALITIGLTIKIVAVSWKGFSDAARMLKARKYAFIIHLAFCIIIIVSSLVSILI